MKSPNQTHGPHSLSFLEWTTTIAPSPAHMSCPSWKKPPAPLPHIPILPGINHQHSLWGYIPYPSWREPPNSIPVHILCFLARRGPTGSHWVFFTLTILVFFGVHCSAVRCEMATSPNPIHPSSLSSHWGVPAVQSDIQVSERIEKYWFQDDIILWMNVKAGEIGSYMGMGSIEDTSVNCTQQHTPNPQPVF